ncbi:ribosome hibernation-promoting factor, HPF/YfiA family [Actinocorallia libanotica]|uniref:ribosome hibernation-promoting factor, HPF/YfiA family n=1 Tax=Actinocorallia libanotica TaxID=46162 RepID=UPI0031D0D738
MDIIVRGRRTDVNDRFRRHVDTKLAKFEKLDSKIIQVDVEVSEERNPRQAGQRERVELTVRSKGPVIRAEAAADDRYGALDVALDKLDTRMRRAADRRKIHHGTRTPAKYSGIEPMPTPLEPSPLTSREPSLEPAAGAVKVAEEEEFERPDLEERLLPIPMDGNGPVVVREKHHEAGPMDIQQALYEMELVGHDFFLFRDRESGRPSVVYRRRGWDYGVIRLIEE